MNILITGGNGYLAKSFYTAFKNKYNLTVLTRQNFDLSDYNATCEWFHTKEFDVVLHTAIVGGNRLHEDTDNVMFQNLAMYNNLSVNKDKFKKLISFGSGAEIFHGNTPYANSKREIANLIEKTSNFFNLRIFATFDENELDRRFIKANILRYLKQEPMIVHTDKVMDFFYMKDLISLVEHYINTPDPIKSINCSYKEKYTLTNIANFINTLGDYKVPVIIENKNKLEFYCGESHNLPIYPIGLEWGIYTVYNSLLNGDLIHA